MAQKLKDVWYASEQRAANSFKLFVYDDIGTLATEPGEIEFVSHKQTLHIRDVRRISLVHQAWSWKMYLLVNVLSLPFYFLLYLVINPLFSIGVFPIFAVVVVVNLLGLAVGFSTKWVEIEHAGPQDSITRSYFADGSRKGWRGIFGGTHRLFKLLECSLPYSRVVSPKQE